MWIALVIIITTGYSYDIKCNTYSVDLELLTHKAAGITISISIENKDINNITLGTMYIPIVLSEIDPDIAINNVWMIDSKNRRIFPELLKYDDISVLKFSIWDALPPGEKIISTIKYEVFGDFVDGLLFKEFFYPGDEFTLPIDFYRLSIRTPPGYKITWAPNATLTYDKRDDRYIAVWRTTTPGKKGFSLEYTVLAALPYTPIRGSYLFWGFFIVLTAAIDLALIFRKPTEIDITELENELMKNVSDSGKKEEKDVISPTDKIEKKERLADKEENTGIEPKINVEQSKQISERE